MVLAWSSKISFSKSIRILQGLTRVLCIPRRVKPTGVPGPGVDRPVRLLHFVLCVIVRHLPTMGLSGAIVRFRPW